MDLPPCPHLLDKDPVTCKLCRIARGEWVPYTPEDQRVCLYANRTEIIKQKCGGPIRFGVSGFYSIEPPKADDTVDFYLCHEHRKWWNKYADSLRWLILPKAKRVP